MASRLTSTEEPQNATRALRIALPESAPPRTDDHASAPFLAKNVTTAPTRMDLERDDLSGFSVGHYELGARLGGGGMGRVFLARHAHLEKTVAIKFIAAEFADTDIAVRRFQQEIRAMGQLQHPNIVQAIDAGCVSGLAYLVVEWIDGEDLQAYVANHGPMPAEQAARWIRQVADGLAHFHAHGFVHRDIKPSNLMVTRNGRIKILDFGLVCDLQAGSGLTESGTAMGTWDYLAPEQAHDARRVDPRADIYSLGCTWIYLLCGRAPFANDQYSTPASKLRGHLFDTPTWLESQPDNIPEMLLNVIQRMVAKSPTDRFRNASELSEAIDDASLSPSTSRDPRRRTPLRRDRKRTMRPLAMIATAVCVLMAWISAAIGLAVTSRIHRSSLPTVEASSTVPRDNPRVPMQDVRVESIPQPHTLERITSANQTSKSAVPLQFPVHIRAEGRP